MIVRETAASTGLAPWTREQGGPATADVRDLTVAELLQACQREETRFLAREPSDAGYGYELFRRAICLGDGAAWAGVVAQFRSVLRVWVRRHPALGAAGGAADDWVDQAFSRLWLAVQPARFDQFPDLASLLRYLKLCVHSLLADAARDRRQAARSLDSVVEGGPELPDVALTVTSRITGSELWDVVLNEVEDETERLLLYLSFAQQLKPRQVQARYPERFACVDDVYRMKRNLLDRLRRSPRMARFVA
jgi:hypothetical protein